MRFLVADIAGRQGLIIADLHRLIIQQGDMLSYSTLLDIWNNKTTGATLATLQKIAKALGCKVADLLSDEA